MTPTPWVPVLKPIQNGEAVNAQVSGREPGQLAQRTQYLKDVLDSIAAGEALYARNVALDPLAQTGQAVYWDATLLEYRPAIANVVFDNTVGGFVIADSSFPVGIVSFKYTATRGDILIMGKISNFDFTNAIGSSGSTPAEAGPYFLSASEPGHYTKQKPPVSVYIGFLQGDSSAVVMPTPRDILEQHVHYAFDLVARPAGVVECPAQGLAYNFIEVDPNRPGWLPADDPIFLGLAPPGAKLGYNLAQQPELSRLWPPLPNVNAYVEVDGIGANPASYQIDNTTIWWFNDCYGKAPWPTEPRPCDLVSSSSSNSSESSSSPPMSSSSSNHHCDSGPALESAGFAYTSPFHRRIKLYFTKMVFKTNNTVVTSLRALQGSPITVTSCDGLTPASVGDLCLGLDLALSIIDGIPGYHALKDISGQQFKRGPMVEAIKAGTDIVITPLVGESEVDGAGYVYGKMILSSIQAGSLLQEGLVSLVSLNGAREDQLNGVFFLTLPSAKSSSLVGRIVLPAAGPVVSPKMTLVFWFLGRTGSNVSLPPMQLSYKRLPRPDGCTQVTLPSGNTSLTDLGTCQISAGTYVEETSDPFVVNYGDEIIFTLTRPAPDVYAGDVGILKLGYQLTPT